MDSNHFVEANAWMFGSGRTSESNVSACMSQTTSDIDQRTILSTYVVVTDLEGGNCKLGICTADLETLC